MANVFMIFGGAGFIGTAITEKIKSNKEDSEIVVIDNFSMTGLTGGPLADEVINLDCSNVNDVTNLISTYRPTHVLHLAANSDIGRSFDDPRIDLINTFQTSAAIALAILQSSHNVKHFAFASSSAIFGFSEERITEHSFGLPESPYGWMKLASEKLFETLFDCHHISNMHFFRFPNVTGKGQTHGVVKDLVQKYLETSKRWEILGDGSQDKPYIHVVDLVEIILSEVSRESQRSINHLNIAPDDTLTVSQIVQIIQERGGLQREPVFGDKPFGWDGDITRYSYNTQKMKSLGYSLRDSFSAVVQSVHEEFQKYGM
jgi:UDP-glucose 4-epimerase